MSTIPVWIDCDTGVDDAIAILTAGQQDGYEIVGISTVAGNVPLKTTTRNSLRICDLMGQEHPVYPGASQPWIKEYVSAAKVHGEDGLGGALLPEPLRKPEEIKAWDAIYREAVKHGGSMELVATGPLTNIATAITLYPDLKNQIKRILIMGGAATGGNVTPCAEFNIYVDPEAAQTVFRCGLPIYMFGLDVTSKAYVTLEELQKLHAEHDTKVTEFVLESAGSRTSYYMADHIPGACMHDVCPVLYLSHPEIFTLEEAGVFVETQSELTMGKTVTDVYSDYQFPEKNAMVALDVDREAFVSYMFEALKKYL